MITGKEIEKIGFVQQNNGSHFLKKGDYSHFYIKLENGFIVYIKEVRNNTVLKYPCHIDDLKDFILTFEVISGVIIRDEIEELDKKMHSNLIMALLAIIALFLVYFLFTIIKFKGFN